jgi:hypothetical protein
VKTVVDAEVASILEKKDPNRLKDKMLVDDSSDDDFLEDHLDSLEEFKSWSTRKMSSMETMLKALYDAKFPSKATEVAKPKSANKFASSREPETSSYEVVAVDVDAEKSMETSLSRSPLPAQVRFQLSLLKVIGIFQ